MKNIFANITGTHVLLAFVATAAAVAAYAIDALSSMIA